MFQTTLKLNLLKSRDRFNSKFIRKGNLQTFEQNLKFPKKISFSFFPFGNCYSLQTIYLLTKSSKSFVNERFIQARNFHFNAEVWSQKETTEEEMNLSEILSNKVCNGCGAKFQTKDELKPGYISSKLFFTKNNENLKKLPSKNDFSFLFVDELKKIEEINAQLASNPELAKDFETESQFLKQEEKKRSQSLFCKRCWYLKHYNQVLPISINYEDLSKNLEIIKERSKHRTSILKIVDIFDFDSSIIKDFQNIVGDKPLIYLVVNKLDLLPKGVSYNRVRQWVRKKANELNLAIKDVFLVSSLNGFGVNSILETLNKNKPRFTFVVGRTNSGKSTFVNNIISRLMKQNMKLHGKGKPTISNLPGTTLNVISFPLRKGMFLFDTPGIHTSNHPLNFLTLKELHDAIPSKKIIPKIFFLKEGKTIFLGGMGRLDLISGPRTYFTVFVSHKMTLHQTKLEKADLVYKNHLGTLLQPPCFLEEPKKSSPKKITEGTDQTSQTSNNISQHVRTIPPLVPVSLSIEGNSFKNAVADIVFPGLGWISVTGKGRVEVVAWGMKDNQPFLRDAPLMPFETPKPGRKPPFILKST